MYKSVTGVDNTTIDITGLEPVTMYTVAVRAFTAVGFGLLGEHKSVTTAAGVPSAGPIITSIVAVNSTSLNLMDQYSDIESATEFLNNLLVVYAVT